MIDISGVKIGGGNFAIIAGPCSVESETQILEVARSIKASGASLLRGGAFKPRTSPYDFQGMKAEGIELLLEAKKDTGMPIVTEIMNEKHHAELRASQGAGQDRQAYTFKERTCQYIKRIADERRIYNVRGQ